MIDDYYEKIRTGKQEKPFEELIIQIGNKDDMNASSENGQLARQMLDEYMQSFQQRNPTLRVFSAHLHMDEATPHLHIDFIPFTTGSKRGLETCVSLKKALEALGFPLNMRYAYTTEGRLIPIPQPRPAEDFGCRADGRSALLVRFAAVWAAVRQQLCFKAVFC